MKHPHLMSTLDFRDGATFGPGAGTHLVDIQSGKPFMDFFCDVGTSSLGYASPEQQMVLMRLLREHIPAHAPNLYLHSERDRAAQRITAFTGMDRVFFCNSGAEAAEAAIKLARLFHHKLGTGRHVIATYKGGFHGRTLATLAAGDGPPYHSEGFGPLPEGFMHFRDISEIPRDAAAIMLAPVFGNNDVIVYPEGWLSELREYANEHGILLIFDEVQTGAGRSGLHYTYAQRVGIRPDILTMGKGVAMGVPTGVCLARGRVADTFTPGSHFSTFGGNPICCAFVNGMLDWAENAQRLNLDRVEEKGQRLRARLGEMPWAKNVRGVGMLLAFDLETDTLDFAKRCFSQRLLVGAFRAGPGAVKVTPPLNCTLDDIERGVELMDSALRIGR
jgi:acetylornithine/N-succinyldiaminopimelate aminotransferase